MRTVDDLSPEARAHYDRYKAAAHAMQTGVGHKMHFDNGETSPKHLRVGVNAAMVEHGALVGLLVAKGLFTEEEFYKALADKMEEEAASYQHYLSGRFGADVTLG